MKGYKVTCKNLKGKRIDCFTGFLKTREDAEKYAEWIGQTAQIREYEKERIATYATYDESNFARLKYD